MTFTGPARGLKEDHGIETFVSCDGKGDDYCARNPWIAGFARGRPEGFRGGPEISMMRAVLGRSRIEMSADVWSRELGVRVRPTLPVYEASENEVRWARDWFRRQKIDPARSVAIQPVAHDVWRTWPAPLARQFVRLVEESGMKPLVFHNRVDEIERIGGRRVVAGEFWQAAAILSLCPLFVGVDSGLFHLAAALGVPGLGLFGSTTGRAISQIYPQATYLQGAAPGHCIAPCHKRTRRGYVREKCWHVGCEAMWRVDPVDVMDQVEARLKALLKGQAE